MIKLNLPGSIRSKKNSKQIVAVPANRETSTKHHWAKLGWQYCYMTIHPSSGYKKWEREARIDVAKQADLYLFTGPVIVKMVAYYKGKRPDLSGAMESVGDCLEGLAWVDDAQIERWHGDSCLIHCKDNPRTEVWIDECKM